MKKSVWMLLWMVAFYTPNSFASDAPAAAADVTADAPALAPTSEPAVPTPSGESAAVVAAVAAEAIEAVPQDATLADNLEFISGEVSELDEAGKSVSVRLYGENEDAATDKVLKVTVDENTDITDGEQDRELKSLATGTEVDVEYDPATNKATYIFVY